jgi:hypothetical protein
MVQNRSVECRRAIEALRSGVPNLDVVQALGSSQPGLEKAFASQLEMVRASLHQGKTGSGLLLAGGFGSGKSHLLECFRHMALEENFVCSKIVISKETPLYNPAKVFQAALASASVPERRGLALTEIAARLDFKSEIYARLVRWVNANNNGLSSQFAATLFLYEYAGGDDELRDRILRFWGGDPLNVSEIRRYLKDLGEAATYKIDKLPIKELAVQRYSFISQLIIAAGYSGWVLLIDEVELMGRYSIQQRARSYAEIARLMGKLEGSTLSGFTAIMTISDDFESAVLDYRNDEEIIPAKFSQSNLADANMLINQAQKGMQLIRRNKLVLDRLTPEKIHETFERLREIYTSAYGWKPEDAYRQPDITARIRQHIKKWIMEWDLKRLYPDYLPNIESVALSQDYAEAPELETSLTIEPAQSENQDEMNGNPETGAGK